LGTECVEYLKATRASQGNLLSCILPVSSAFLCFFIRLFFPSCAADALSAANARISSLEAELEASRKAFDAAAAAKTTAEKSTKSALAKAKKAERALIDANQGRIQREQAVTEHLNKISALAGGKYHAFPFFVGFPILILIDVCFLILCLCP
jgi:septal ring factor EnvC (AmiA/AmiB activator)